MTHPQPTTLNGQDLTTLSRAELLTFKQQLDTDIAAIKMQLDQARLVQQETGQYADRSWYVRARHALLWKGQESQAIQAELSRRKEKKNERPDTLESRFIEIARQKLADEVFTDILSEAQGLTTETE